MQATSISIHLMLLFNYILVAIRIAYAHFNTSNVTIQQVSTLRKNCAFFYFNTSNVTIQRQTMNNPYQAVPNFITSNVTIQRYVGNIC